MKLEWKDILNGGGDAIAVGAEGSWVVFAGERAETWHLGYESQKRGKIEMRGTFYDRGAAMQHAQDREDGIPIVARRE